MAQPGRMLTELVDRWTLPFEGLTVTQIWVDFALALCLDDQGVVRISGSARLGWTNVEDHPDQVELEPERQEVAAGLELFNRRVLSAVAFKSGALRILFDNGRKLTVDPDPGHEVWEATGPDGMLVVSLPGGDLAVWNSEPWPPVYARP